MEGTLTSYDDCRGRHFMTIGRWCLAVCDGFVTVIG